MHKNTEEAYPFIDLKNGENLSEIWLKLNGFVSIEAAEAITTLYKTTQYRERLKGRFSKLISLTSQGRRKAYRIQPDLNSNQSTLILNFDNALGYV